MEMSTFSKIVRRIKQHGLTYKIQQLCLDQIKIVLFTQQISNLIQTCIKIQHLSLCNCELNSLINFPILQNINILQLSFNHLEGQHLQPLAKCTKLYSLSLDGNCIKDYAWTRFFKKTRLAQLSLRDNPITREAEYREKVYKLLGADLDDLDGIDRQGRLVDQSQSSSEESDENLSQESGISQQQQEDDHGSEEVEDSINKKMKLQEKGNGNQV